MLLIDGENPQVSEVMMDAHNCSRSVQWEVGDGRDVVIGISPTLGRPASTPRVLPTGGFLSCPRHADTAVRPTPSRGCDHLDTSPAFSPPWRVSSSSLSVCEPARKVQSVQGLVHSYSFRQCYVEEALCAGSLPSQAVFVTCRRPWPVRDMRSAQLCNRCRL
ncbi:hypothetical protein J6590_058181 [Homalodisca vitripennis]|nr:hypothetical protein J6590_058181 [Homalodisca vitripennis]